MTITALPTCSPKIKGKRDNLKNQSRIFQVESTLFEVNAAKLCEVSPTIKKIVSKNMETHSPIVLHGHTSQKFENFLWALSVDSIPPPLNEKTLERLLDVEELSKRYSVRELQVRTESDLLATITEGTNPAILACSSRSLVRMLQIVLRVHNNTLFSFLIQMWAWRLHSRELRHVHAMRLAQPTNWNTDPQPFLKLLGHAFYAAMVEMEPKLSSGEPIDVESPLTRSELTHIRCGYLSLRCWWSQLASKPPSFKHSPRCMYPEKCSYAWRLKFEGLAETEKIPFPKVDGIRRLQEVQKCLTVDPFLTKFMPETCRHNALQELQKCRENLLRQLHHHFDL